MRKIAQLLAACLGLFAPYCALAGAAPDTPPSLDTVQRRAFDFFWNETDPATGLTKDREINSPAPRKYRVASIAATGYMLAALPIAVERHWISKAAAYKRCVTSLRFIHDRMPNVHGFYYHFVDWKTGARVWNCEISSIDTALLAMGALTAGEYWPHTKAHRLAACLAAYMDWNWLRTNGNTIPSEPAPSMGWDPKKGFIAARWKGYSEAAYLYLLALGTTPPYGLPRSSWNRWAFPTVVQEGFPVFGGPSPLFMAQMTPCYYDLRGLRDRQGRDWWTAWKNAHLADQAYCARSIGNRTYGAGFWGINASDQPGGYGADSPADDHNTGTVSPTAMLAAMVFTPESSAKALTALGTFRAKIWGRYGFSNAFNIDRDWYGPDVIGIDLGMMLLMTENARSGLIWRLIQHSAIA